MALTKFSFLGKLSLNCSSLLCSLSESSNQLTLFFLQQSSKNFQLYEMITKGFLLVYNCWYTMKNSFTLFPIPWEKILMFQTALFGTLKQIGSSILQNPRKLLLILVGVVLIFEIWKMLPYLFRLNLVHLDFHFLFLDKLEKYPSKKRKTLFVLLEKQTYVSYL